MHEGATEVITHPREVSADRACSTGDSSWGAQLRTCKKRGRRAADLLAAPDAWYRERWMRWWLVAGLMMAPGMVARSDVPEPPADRIELTFGGDVMFGRLVEGTWWRYKDGYDPFARIAHLLKSDLAVVNLETTVVSKLPKLIGNLRFAATPAQLATLSRHGIGVVQIANNHSGDLDVDGLVQTPEHVRAAGMIALGAPTPEPRLDVVTVVVRGWKVGFIAATTWLSRKHRGAPYVPLVRELDLEASLVPLVKTARANHDVVVVMLHWGYELEAVPTAGQETIAHALIDAGADALIGTHPHVLQKIERYKSGVIAYSLGNLVFPSAYAGPRRTGVLRLAYRRTGRCLAAAIFHPAVMRLSPAHHPEPERAAVPHRLVTLSGPKTVWRVVGDRFEAPADCR